METAFWKNFLRQIMRMFKRSHGGAYYFIIYNFSLITI